MLFQSEESGGQYYLAFRIVLWILLIVIHNLWNYYVLLVCAAVFK